MALGSVGRAPDREEYRSAASRGCNADRFRPWPPCFQQLTSVPICSFVPFCSNNQIQARLGTPIPRNRTAEQQSALEPRQPAPEATVRTFLHRNPTICQLSSRSKADPTE